MPMQHRLQDQGVHADTWTLFCARMLAENESHDGDTSPGGKGNTHLRVRLRSQRKN